MKKKTRLTDMIIEEGTLCQKGKNSEARVLLWKMDDLTKATKTEGGKEYPASAFAYVPDPEKPSTWKLRLIDDSGEMTAKQVGMAVAALGAGFRGNKVQIPEGDLAKVKAKVRAAWKKVNPDAEEVPAVLKSESVWGKIKGFLKAMTMDQVSEANEARSDWWQLCNDFQDSVKSILADETADQAAMLTQSCMQFINRAKPLAPYMSDMMKAEGALTALEAIAEDVSKAGKKISAANMDKLKAAMRVLQEMMGSMEMDGMEPVEEGCKPKVKKSKGDDTMTFEEFMKSLTEDQQKAMQAEIEKQAQEAVNKAVEDVKKSATPEMEAIQKKLDDMAKTNEVLAKALEVEKDQRITKEFEEVAKQYQDLPGVEVATFGKLLKDLNQKAPDQYAELIKVLDTNKGVHAENKLILMKELGGNQVPENDAGVQLEKLAKSIQETEKVTFAVAYDKALRENPQLYDEYNQQKRSN